MNDSSHPQLAQVKTDEEWAAFHHLRRTVLFESRGTLGVYNPEHPHDRVPANHPVILIADGSAVAAMRIDLPPDEPFSIMRTVAVRTDLQRRGYGRLLLALAHDFSLRHGRDLAVVFSAEDAVEFYTKCGYKHTLWDPDAKYGKGTQMVRALA